MNHVEMLIVSVALCAIGLSLVEADGPHVCPGIVQVPYKYWVTSEEYEWSYKYKLGLKCCPGYVGNIDNCMPASTTSKEPIASSEVSLLADYDDILDTSSTDIFTEEEDIFTHSSEETTQKPSDETETSEYSTASQSENTDAVTDVAMDFAEPILAGVPKIIRESIESWWSVPTWLLCIAVLVTIVVLLTILVYRNTKRVYVVNKKATSPETHC